MIARRSVKFNTFRANDVQACFRKWASEDQHQCRPCRGQADARDKLPQTDFPLNAPARGTRASFRRRMPACDSRAQQAYVLRTSKTKTRLSQASKLPYLASSTAKRCRCRRSQATKQNPRCCAGEAFRSCKVPWLLTNLWPTRAMEGETIT